MKYILNFLKEKKHEDLYNCWTNWICDRYAFYWGYFFNKKSLKKRKAYLKLSTLTNGKYKLEISNTKEEGTYYLFPKKVDLLHFLRKGPFPKNTFISFDKKGVCIGELIESLNNDTSHSQN